jgi:hypothetical protein
MAIFITYAEILTEDHTSMRAYKAGITKKHPGLLIQDILDDTGGVYAYNLRLPEEVRERVRRVAELTSDKALLGVANLPEVTVSLENLRYVDPRTTRVVCGHRLYYTPEESDRLGLRHEGPFDPRNTIHIL